MKEQHKLCAIMFTDIVGYSALMSKDEQQAMSVLEKNRTLNKAAIARFNGKYIKEVGDGTLAVFYSSYDAVNCAFEIQKACSAEQSLKVRIGIHIGDIIESEGDVFGDGVNVAFRIESAGEPGGIYISEKVYDDIKNKTNIRAEFYGEKTLKNIPDPVRIYIISAHAPLQSISIATKGIPGENVPSSAPVKNDRTGHHRKWAALAVTTGAILIAAFFVFRSYYLRSNVVSGSVPIAVISFMNQTGDTNFNYLQQAIPNLLITNLEQSKLFQVLTWERMQDVVRQLGRKDVEIIDSDLGFEICRKEGYRFIVIGSFVKAGEVFATDAKVLEVETKKIINSVSSRGEDVGSIIKTQIDDLSRGISKSVGISARKIESAPMHIRDVTTTSLEAYNYFLRGREAYDKFYYTDAKEFLGKAVKIDPGFAMAYLYLSKTFDQLQLGNIRQRDQALEKAYLASSRATENEQLSIYAAYAGLIEQDPEKQLDLLLTLADKSPRDKRVFFAIGQWYMRNGLPDEAIDAFLKALDLDPEYGEIYNQLAYLYFNKGEINTALEYNKKYAALNPDDANPFDSMGDLLWRMGRLDEAVEQFGKALNVRSEFWPSAAKTAYIYAMKEDYRKSDQWLRKTLDAAWSESIKANIYWSIAFMHHFYGKTDQAMQALERSAAIGNEYENDLYRMGPYFLKAYIFYDRGEHAKALDQYASYLRIARNEPSIGIADDLLGYFLFRGLIDIELGNLDSALYYSERIRSLAKDPTGEYYFNYLVREVQIASAKNPTDLDNISPVPEQPIPGFVSPYILIYNLPYMRNSLAEAYHRFGMPVKAIAEYERLTTFDPAEKARYLINPRYHYYLGIICQEEGMNDEAVAQFRKFLDLWQDADQDLSEPEDARKRIGQLLD